MLYIVTRPSVYIPMLLITIVCLFAGCNFLFIPTLFFVITGLILASKVFGISINKLI